MTNIPQSSAYAGFLIDLKDFRIASIICDDHGRVACNVVYECLNDYQIAFSKWRENLQSEKSKREKQVLEMKGAQKMWLGNEWVEQALLCTEFSQYVRTVHDLQVNYG